MQRIVLLCALLAFGSMVNGQQRRLDSILALNNAHPKEDSLKAVYLREVFRAYNAAKNFPKAEIYLDSAIRVASRLPNKAILTRTYFKLGSAFHNSNRLRAITFYNKSAETARSNNDLVGEASAYLNLGALYMDIRDLPKSLEMNEKAMPIFEQAQDEEDRVNCQMNISSIYASMHLYTKSMEYARKSLKSFEASSDFRGIGVACEQILSIYFDATDNELREIGLSPANRNKEIETILEKGLKGALKDVDRSVVSSFYRGYGKLYERQGNLSAAQQSYTKAVSYLNGDDLEESYVANVLALGEFYVNGLNDEKGVGLMHIGLKTARTYKSTGSEEAVLNALSMAHEKFRNYDSSLYYFKQAIVVKDSIYSKEREQEITRRQLKIDFDLKEHDYRTAQQLADARLKQQEQQILLRNQQLQISDKEKTLQRLTFLQKQAELENQKKLQANQLVQEQQKAMFETQARDQQIKVQHVQLAMNRRISLFLGVLAVIVIAVAMFIFNSRRKTVALNRIVSEQKANLEELVAVKDKIFSVVSHDMRAPVNNLVAFSSLLDDGNIEQERLARYVEQLKGTLDHTSSMMENVLNWAASQMQGFKPIMDEVNLSAVAEQVLAGIAPSLQKKKIDCVNRIHPGIVVRGDRNMVELIIRNLLNNAVKFSHPNSAIELSVAEARGRVELRVRDNGVGMPLAKVHQINNNAAHTLNSTLGTGKEKGTGLGLMLCQHFANLMGGSIFVESEEGKGSLFVLICAA